MSSTTHQAGPESAAAAEALPIRIFISYRRDDVGGLARALESDLKPRFGDGNVFRDVTALKQFAGVPFERVIDEYLDQADVELVLIGPEWGSDENRRRLQDETDLHRREIEGAFQRGLVVIAVLMEGAAMPDATELPSSLAELQALQSSVPMDDLHWNISDLAAAIETRVAERREAKRVEIEREEREAQEGLDRTFAAEAERAAEVADFERARQAAGLIHDPGRRVEALLGVARRQTEAGAVNEAQATLGAVRAEAPEIEDKRARTDALARVEVEQEECARELIKWARDHLEAGRRDDARAALDAARAAADRLEVATAREEALAEVESLARELGGGEDPEREERVRELVRDASSRSDAEAQALLDSAGAAALEIEDAECRRAAQELVARAAEQLRGRAQTKRFDELLAAARERLAEGKGEEARAGLAAAREAAEAIEESDARDSALAEVATVEASIADAEHERQVRDLVGQARTSPADRLDQIQELLGSATTEAEQVADPGRRSEARTLITAARQDLLGGRGLFQGATELTGLNGTIVGDSSEASKEPGEPDHAGNTGGKSVWYRWIAPETGGAEIDTFGSNFDTLLAVYRGPGVDRLEPVAANDDYEGRQSKVEFRAEVGEEYMVAVDGFAGAYGRIVLSWHLLPPPANDDFGRPEEIVGESGTIHGDNRQATKEPGEPAHAGREGGRSVWYRWTVPSAGTATLDTVGTEFDTVLAVYRGASLADLETVAENDDAVGLQSRVSFRVNGGEECLIAVDGCGAACGPLTLNWRISDAPANDDLAGAEEIFGANGQALGDNTGATKEPGEPDHAGNVGGRSVWFRWTAPSDSPVVFDTFGSDFDTLLAVYRGSRLAELEWVAANDESEGTQSRVTFAATEGETYTIAVDGYGGAAGRITLNWQLPAPLAQIVRASGLHFSELGDGTLSLPFTVGDAETVVEAREEGDLARFAVRLPDVPGPGFVKGAIYETLLRLSFLDYVKALAPAPGEVALAVEQRTRSLAPAAADGLIRCLAPFGSLRQKDLADRSGWQARLQSCLAAQADQIQVDVARTSGALPQVLREAGVPFELLAGGSCVAQMGFGLQTAHVHVVVGEHSISFRIRLAMKPKGSKRKFLTRMLELNEEAQVAKAALDTDGDIALLYETSRLHRGVVEDVRDQFALLLAGVAALHGG